MKLTMVLPMDQPLQWRLARQVGVEGAVFSLHEQSLRDPDVLTYQGLKKYIDRLRDEDLELSVIEGDLAPLDETKLGLSGKDREIDKYLDVLRLLGDHGIPIVCNNFMAGVNWVRTETGLPLRGKALTTAFQYDQVKNKHFDTQGAILTEEVVWDNLFYFMEKILPVAEASGVKMALHPDDPPLSPLGNIARILTRPQAYHKLFEKFPSESNGMTFCQANFKLMDGDLYKMATAFGESGKIFFVHFRDVEGDKYNFKETFHDDGPTDMARMMRIYHKYIPETPLRPDHVPTLEGDDNTNFGYTMRGRLYAAGYIKGLMDSLPG